MTLRDLQSELYGAPVDRLAAEMAELLGLDTAGVAATIGVSTPMFEEVRSGRRARIGNPVATARLALLTEFCGHLRAGRAQPADIPLTLRQIRSSSATAVSPVPPAAEPPPAEPARASPATDGGLGLTEDDLRAARRVVAAEVLPTPTRRWPLLEEATGLETWVKHENHCPTGAFKVRGGLVYLDRLLASGRPVRGLVTATRGNHGQSLAYAGRARGVPVVVVVPEHNSPDKNRAMAGYGARVVVAGRDFQEAREHAARLAEEEGLTPVPSFHPWLVAGVATYAAELHDAVADLDAVYVPVGMGSGACAQLAVRDLRGLRTEVVGVVADRAPAYALSVEAGEPVSTPDADTFVDGVACREPDPDAVRTLVEAHRAGTARVVRVSEEQARSAMRMMYDATHNLAEPAGALALAGLLADDGRSAAAARVAVVHSGGNCDLEVLTGADVAGPS